MEIWPATTRDKPSKAMMTVLKKNNWRSMLFNAKALLRNKPMMGVGVDVGSRLIKSVSVQADQNGLTLENFAIHPGAAKSLKNEPSQAEVHQSLQPIMPLPVGTVGTSLSGPSVLVKPVTLPVMAEEDIRDHLALELDRYIALDAQDVFWDVYKRKVLPESRTDQQEYFLVVAKKECVEQKLEVFSQHGVTIQFIDIDAFALVNLVVHNYGREGTWLLAHIGPTGMVMVVIVQGEPMFIRRVAYEADWYVDLLDQVAIPQDSAEGKKELGASEMLLLDKFFQEAREQICETLESFSDRSAIGIDRGILLSGGYVVAPEMAKTLSHSFRMPVNLLEPFRSIRIPQVIQQDRNFHQIAHLMGVAMGVALRGAISHD